MEKPAIVVFQIHQEEFSFLGIENVVTESSNFGHFWNNFFKMGGYDKITPYAIDPKPINVWCTNSAKEKIYFQGMMVGDVNEVPAGYTLAKFPASDFFVVTYEWVPNQDFQMMDEINGGQKYIETLQIPEGYVMNDGSAGPITLIEKENTDTLDGSRYEFWVPIKKVENNVNNLLKAEDIINEKLTGSSQKNALDFVAFLHANELTLDSNADGEGWAVGGIVGNSIGYMLINGAEQMPGPWTIWFNSCDFDSGMADDELKDTAWAHASNCGQCHPGWKDCGGGERTIFGKVFERLCHSPLMFTNPDAKTLENVKRLILMLK